MLWLVGNGSREFDAYCQKHGITYCRFTTIKQKANGISTIYVNMLSKATLHDSLASLPERLDVSALFVAGYEHYVQPAAWLAQYYNVAGNSPAAAARATDKLLMRQAFQNAATDLTPSFTQITAWGDVNAFMRSHDFPVMLKPANLMKSLYVTRSNDIEALRQNYDELQRHLPAAYRRYHLAQPRVIMEECMSGSMHTVAGFVTANGTIRALPQVVDCITAENIGIDDSYLFSRRLPSRLALASQQAIITAATRAVAAIGLRSSPFHAELMLTTKGPKIIEIGSRLGGYRPRMYEQAYGIDLYAPALQIAYGKQPEFRATQQHAISIVEIFPKHDGKFVGPLYDRQLHRLPSFKNITYKSKPGDAIGIAKHGFRATAVITLQHQSSEQVIHDETIINQLAWDKLSNTIEPVTGTT